MRNAWSAIVLSITLSACASAEPPKYGVPVRFAKDRDVVFPDFTVRYLGERRVASPMFKPGFRYYDFEVRAGSETKPVSWSSGTGVIDSTSFEVGGKPYELELRGSVAKKGWLRDDEMVIWPREDFLRALKASQGTR